MLRSFSIIGGVGAVLAASPEAATATAETREGNSKKPHILAILQDDYGWADASWHRPAGYKEVVTPNMQALVDNGIEMDRQYAFKFCSPTRTAIQTGRSPIHVNTLNLDPLNHNPNDPVSGYSAAPRNMTAMGNVMKLAGYHTAFTGKYDCGMATNRHTPKGRGYDTSLIYFHHMVDYWQSWFEEPNGDTDFFPACKAAHPDLRPRDLWMHNSSYEGPAVGVINTSATCSVGADDVCDFNQSAACQPYPGFPGDQVEHCSYVDDTFTSFALDVVHAHNTTDPDAAPLFLFWAPHAIHTPLQVPKGILDSMDFIDDWRRHRYHAMVKYIDSRIGDVVDALKAKGMFENTLIFYSSDNGGPIYKDGGAGANNYPLKGGKASNWEGGVRVNGWVSGGALPLKMRGTKLDGLATVWDWLATFADAGGLPASAVVDHEAAAVGLPPFDSISLWPWLSGAVAESPRKQVVLGVNDGEVNGVIVDYGNGGAGGGGPANATGLWKRLQGKGISSSGWTGPECPNASYVSPGLADCDPFCLFRLDQDPTEHHDLQPNATAAATAADRVAAAVAADLEVRIVQANATGFRPDRGPQDPGSCLAAVEKHGGFWGPWVE